jgi:hypothetical protein
MSWDPIEASTIDEIRERDVDPLQALAAGETPAIIQRTTALGLSGDSSSASSCVARPYP